MPYLSAYNSFNVNAYTKQVATIDTIADLSKLDVKGLTPFYVIGEGSNTLFASEEVSNLIKVNLKGIDVQQQGDGHLLTVAAGENWHTLVEQCTTNNMPGIENLALIPGSVGAAPVQNIGAYGVEFADVCRWVKWYEFASGKVHKMSKEECEFSYRESIFKQQLKGKGIIIEVGIFLSHAWQPKLHYAGLDELSIDATPVQVMEKVIEIRQSKLPDPTLIPNAGSFFKNPVVERSVYEQLVAKFGAMPNYPVDKKHIKLAAGWLIDQAGLKGYAHGNVAIHDKQALVLTNPNNGNGEELVLLAKYALEQVKDKFGISLEPEVRMVTEKGDTPYQEVLV
ncbi:UDP-N-acetylmuramate dehydrogenase [Thalassotalea agarivorans]|uniref:UDP-N-acetylenolpyruvoylglucosamine reductase n=1 Tax=Thalassotalea agarivorans TaxID=349064 RepID=A0A1I0I6X0_THASX|nr:UDP-N-acetylmuramate dehydrogenase [Thalassotalea agarivorans]SET92094.1 UDP-N-acetylmuramate dehydrogenase [Thalassotalea agarivorans]